MISYSSSVTIARPPTEVFTYLMEPSKQALWSDVPMRRLTEGPMAKGSRMEVSFGMGPLKAVVGLEITDVVEDERLAFDTFSGPIKWKGAYSLRPVESGTELSQEGSLTFTGLWRLMEGMAGREISSGEVKELEKLKAVVEGS